ncbi:TRIM3 [Branchiostoma lanceolatum]|uniref:TRIM3 protein n=1 Tax=Branchiostoma lanceolatum TaxID=7740 RepID=A0A8J9ZSS1_BRALA|nr:TRIM3 [Branchiostoma lanceolatum]
MNKAVYDSDSGASDEIPDNMGSTQAALPHIRDSSESFSDPTTEPVDQHDTQPQLHWISTTPEKQKDISPGHVQSDASVGYVDQDAGRGCSPDNRAERSSLPAVCTPCINISKIEQNQALYGERYSLPTVCTSYTQVDQAEQNQTLYVDNRSVETEESPPEDFYDTKACNADNVVQYQLTDTCRNEASATVYQCDGDVDDASGDRPDVPVHDANSKAQDVNQDETRPKTVTKESKDAESCDQNKAENTAVSDDDCIRPYAVAYHRDGKTNGEPYAVAFDEQDGTRPEPIIKQSKDAKRPDQNEEENTAVPDDECIRPYAAAYCGDGETNGDPDVQPYAVAYDEQDEHHEDQTPTSEHSVRGQPAPGTSSEPADNKADELLSNPMYQGNALRPNPMYAPNAVQPRAGGGHGCVESCLVNAITKGVVVAIITVLSALIIATFMSGKQGSSVQTTWTDPTFTGKTTDDVTQHMDYTTSPQTSTAEKGSNESKQSRIVFGEEGEELGQFSDPSDVVVSPSNEIFVADYLNRRVQVFNMTGAYLRQFPTIVSREEYGTMEPNEISIDGEGHLWVLGEDDFWTGFIVRYTKMGRLLTTLQPTFSNSSLLGMAVDTIRRIVVITASRQDAWGSFEYGEVKLLHFDGTVVLKFRTGQGLECPGRVAVGREGNLFFSDHLGDTQVYVYNNTGHYLFSLGGDKIGEGQIEINDGQAEEVSGICTDSSGNVLVSTGIGGTVELFTKDGRYVRRVVSGMFRADSVAVATEAAILLPLTLLVISLGSRDDK